MITIKNAAAIRKMAQAGHFLATMLQDIAPLVKAGVTTLELDTWIADRLRQNQMVSKTKGYMGYKHSSCISVNDELVHGVPRSSRILKEGDLVTIDVCASWEGYCADMARNFFVGEVPEVARKLVNVAQRSLDKGIEKARAGNRLGDISSAIQQEIEKHGFGVVRDFAGHGIGKQMHEDPEILNYGTAGKGPLLQPGMAFAIEPMLTEGHYDVYVDHDGWTVKTVNKRLCSHVEDTIIVTHDEPLIITRLNGHTEHNLERMLP